MSMIEPNPETAIAEPARAALAALEQAWAYYTPQPLPARPDPDPAQELFQYHDAA